MTLSNRVRSISYLKAHAAELVRELDATREPLVITQNGEARAVLLDVASFDALQETGALLKMLAIGEREVREGAVQTADEALAALRQVEP